jgi:hypothetical protein
MSLSNVSETALLALVFNNTSWANVGDATGLVGSTAAGSFFIALHTADPGEAGNQSTSEANYTGYARVAVPRTTLGWTVAGNQVSNAALVQFGLCTAGSSLVTHFSIGTASTGTGSILLKGALTASLNVAAGIQPQYAPGQLAPTVD